MLFHMFLCFIVDKKRAWRFDQYSSLRIAFAEFALSCNNKIGQKRFQLSSYRWRKKTERMQRTDISLNIAPSGGRLKNCAASMQKEKQSFWMYYVWKYFMTFLRFFSWQNSLSTWHNILTFHFSFIKLHTLTTYVFTIHKNLKDIKASPKVLALG